MAERAFQVMAPMRDGVRLNTFVFLPEGAGLKFPVILQRTPYSITTDGAEDKRNPDSAWLPPPDSPMVAAMLYGWQEITRQGYAAVYQDIRGRFGSEGEDRIFGNEVEDGYDTVEWISRQPWCNQKIGLSGSSAGAVCALAAASSRHPNIRAFWSQVGSPSAIDLGFQEGRHVALERLWPFVGLNIPGLSQSHREIVKTRLGLDDAAYEAAARTAGEQVQRLVEARSEEPPFVNSPDWMRLPLRDWPGFARCVPAVDEFIGPRADDEFGTPSDLRAKINVPGFHVSAWYDFWSNSAIATFQNIQSRTGTQKLWIGPNAHEAVATNNFWPRIPYFEWFDHWLKGKPAALIEEPAVYYSRRAWTDDLTTYKPDDWAHSECWPPRGTAPHRLYLGPEGSLSADLPASGSRNYRYDPRHPNPTHGGRNLIAPSGQLDLQAIQARPDYGLIYVGEPLETDLTLAGEVRVTLHVGSDCPDTDFIARLIESRPDGRRLSLLDGGTRAMYRDGAKAPRPLKPGESYQLTVSLGHLRHNISAGSRIEIDVTSSDFPRRARNTNSGHADMERDTEADIRIAANTVHHGEGAPSFVDLTVLSEAD
jgi:putative CocE/NonD family hydrolase